METYLLTGFGYHIIHVEVYCIEHVTRNERNDITLCAICAYGLVNMMGLQMPRGDNIGITECLIFQRMLSIDQPTKDIEPYQLI